MAYTTADEVKEIISGCVLTTDQIDPFILTSHIYLNKVFATDTTLSVMQRREIERWFTAHLITAVGFNTGGSVQPTTIKREKIGDAEVEYAVPIIKTGAGVDSTAYGRMALQLDTTGLLAKAGKMQASIFAVKDSEDDV